MREKSCQIEAYAKGIKKKAAVTANTGRCEAMTQSIDRFVRLNEIFRTTSLGKNTVYRRIKEGTFPKQIRIGLKSVAWRQSAIVKCTSDLNQVN